MSIKETFQETIKRVGNAVTPLQFKRKDIFRFQYVGFDNLTPTTYQDPNVIGWFGEVDPTVKKRWTPKAKTTGTKTKPKIVKLSDLH